ncbi:MAG TPA: carbonic anhydrase [Phycisphaerales bacterium]|nr:carbonic anhydrase [Phycisphaerales bacterium]
MSHIRFSRLSLLAFAAGSCLAFAPGVLADDHAKSDGHGAKPAESGHGDGAKPQYAPPPTAKPVTLKSVPPADKPKAPATAGPKTPVTPVKPVSALKPIPKAPPKSNTDSDNAAAEAVTDTPKTADEALAMLREGNQRWMDGSVQNPSIGALRRKTTADAGQKPLAVVLTCADSRIPVERVFDRGVGEIFVSRVAGNVSGPHEAGTIEYALEHLNVPVLVVMGHAKCGAVKAAAEGAHVTPNIATLVESIRPAVERARKLNPQLEGAELVEAAVRENVWQSVFDLYKGSPTIIEMVRSGKVKVVGAVLDIGTGKVDWLGEHPWQEAIVGALAAKSAPAPAGGHTPAAAVPGEFPAQPAEEKHDKSAHAEPKEH